MSVPYLWAVFTVLGAIGQTARNAMQRELTPALGALGATLVRFLFGVPFALLFLGAVLLATGQKLPAINLLFMLWTLLGACTQIAATALMLMTMERRSFVVTIAYLKTEPMLVALMGLVFLGDPVTGGMVLAIGVAMAGVALISVKAEVLKGAGGWRPAGLGLSSAALFATSAISYRGAILALHGTGYVVPATFALAVGLCLQSVLLVWLLLARRDLMRAMLHVWRPGLVAGFAGAAGSQMWFLAFALATAASVRTLALVEVLFAQSVSHFFFGQKTTAREGLGIAFLLAGAVLIVWASPAAG